MRGETHSTCSDQNYVLIAKKSIRVTYDLIDGTIVASVVVVDANPLL